MEQVNRHAWLIALVVFTVVVVPGFFRLEQINDRLEDQVQRNEVLIGCLTDYSVKLTDALQDRDTVNIIARSAATDLWVEIRRFIKNPPAAQSERQKQLVTAIDRYTEVLNRISRTTELNPYPNPSPCFDRIRSTERFMLMASSSGFPGKWDNYCWGRRVTLRGTLGDDVLHGTDGRDVIFAYAGDDLIVSGKGRDRICARPGDDTVNAGQHYDRVQCGYGLDIAFQAEATRSC